jgi:hypothetical protein
MSRTEVVNDTVLVAGRRITKQQGAQLEPHTVVVPAGMKLSRPGTLGNGSVEHVGRVPGVLPILDLFGGYRFRKKLGAASAAAAA